MRERLRVCGKEGFGWAPLLCVAVGRTGHFFLKWKKLHTEKRNKKIVSADDLKFVGKHSKSIPLFKKIGFWRSIFDPFVSLCAS